MKRWLVLAVLFLPTTARAGGDVSITLTPDGEQLAADLGLTPTELQQQASDALTRVYEVNRVDDFLRAFADATSFSNRGIGVDYASNAESAMIGVAANVAVATDNALTATDDPHPVAGVAANLTVMGGLNLAKWGHPNLTLYGNAFWRSGSYGQLDGSITSMGLHAQYKIGGKTRGAKALVLQWGGIDVTGGLEVSRWSFAATHELDETFTVGSGATSDVTLAATGTFDLDSDAVVAPIEATTSLRVFYFVSVYGGAGIDLQLGKATVDATLDGTMTATDPNGGADVNMGTATVSVNGSNGPSPGKLRGLVGVQANVWKLKAFVQLNAMPFSAASVALGVRVVL